MICTLIKVATILCIDLTPGVKEIECIKKAETTICVNPNYLGDCHVEAAESFVNEEVFDEIELVRWMNESCKEGSGE